MNQSFPPWVIPVIAVSLFMFLLAVGMLLAVFWYMKSKRQTDTTQTGTMPLHNTQYQGGAEIQNQSNAQSSYLNNPTQQPEQINNGAHQSYNYYPQRFDNGTHAFSSQSPVVQSQNLALLPQQENENHGFNYHRLESPDAAQDTAYKDSSGQQVYPQNDPFQSNSYPYNPPYNPHYQVGFQGNH